MKDTMRACLSTANLAVFGALGAAAAGVAAHELIVRLARALDALLGVAW